MPSDPALTAEQEEVERRIEAEIERRLQARHDAELRARGIADPDHPEASGPAWYPDDVTPTDEDMYHRTFPRGTTVQEVLEYDRLQAEARLAAQGGTPHRLQRLPKGAVSATPEEFLASPVGA